MNDYNYSLGSFVKNLSLYIPDGCSVKGCKKKPKWFWGHFTRLCDEHAKTHVEKGLEVLPLKIKIRSPENPNE